MLSFRFNQSWEEKCTWSFLSTSPSNYIKQISAHDMRVIEQIHPRIFHSNFKEFHEIESLTTPIQYNISISVCCGYEQISLRGLRLAFTSGNSQRTSEQDSNKQRANVIKNHCPYIPLCCSRVYTLQFLLVADFSTRALRTACWICLSCSLSI